MDSNFFVWYKKLLDLSGLLSNLRKKLRELTLSLSYNILLHTKIEINEMVKLDTYQKLEIVRLIFAINIAHSGML